MTVTIELPADIEADLVAQARTHSLALPQYVEHLLREQVPARAGSAPSPAERAAAWRESTRGLPHTPPFRMTQSAAKAPTAIADILADTNTLLRRTQPGHPSHDLVFGGRECRKTA